jgi:hypothetical protein
MYNMLSLYHHFRHPFFLSAVGVLEQTVEGWNKHPTPFVWNGKRRRRRERARLRRLGGSGAALAKGYSIAS